MNCTQYLEQLPPSQRCFAGIDNYLFLVNDSGQELKQHYAPEYNTAFNPGEFIRVIDNHTAIAEANACVFAFVVTPDKSVILRDKLPFDTTICRRYIDKIQHRCVFDLFDPTIAKQGHTSDSHINWKNALDMFPKLLKALKLDQFTDQFQANIADSRIFLRRNQQWIGDLVSPANYQLSLDKSIFISSVEIFQYLPSINNTSEIPNEFKLVHSRVSTLFHNPQSITEHRLLIFRDSSAEYYLPLLNSVFRDVFAYWDHWNFNIELINWFKPNYIIEMRTERFLNTNFAHII